VSSPYLVVIDAPSSQLITSGLGLFDHEVAFSDRAPRLADVVEIVPHLLGEPRNPARGT
jgi:hypothetical protein